MASVARVHGPTLNNVFDRRELYTRLKRGRQQSLDAQFQDAPSFNYVLFDKIWDVRPLNLNITDFAKAIKISPKDWHWKGAPVKYLTNGSDHLDYLHAKLLVKFLDQYCEVH